MSDFNRSRGCGAPLMTAAEETSLRSAGLRSACGASLDTCGSVSRCGCSVPVPCGCGSTSCGGSSSCGGSASNGCGSASSCGGTSCGGSGSNGSGNGNGGSESEGCGCCKASMRQALRLLCCNQVSDLLDFDGFAFVTDDLIVGAQPVTMGTTAKDNLSCMSGTFRRFSPCNCDLIDIEGVAYGPFGTLIEVDQATLCSLSAIAFQVPAPEAGGEGSQEACYRRVRCLLQGELDTIDRECGACVCHCDCTDDCCCAEGVLAALSGLSLNKRATLIAGLLALRNVSVLGTIGNVLVLGNDEEYRFYFVCANKVEMLA